MTGSSLSKSESTSPVESTIPSACSDPAANHHTKPALGATSKLWGAVVEAVRLSPLAPDDPVDVQPGTRREHSEHLAGSTIELPPCAGVATTVPVVPQSWLVSEVQVDATARRSSSVIGNSQPLDQHLQSSSDSGEQTAPPQRGMEVIDALAKMKHFEYARARKEAAKALGVSVTVVDDLVKAARSEAAQSDHLPFPEVEPYAEAVDPAQVLDEVTAIILRYVVMSQEQAHAVALWIAMTWFIDDVEVAAILIINAPEKACGKSQLLTIVGYLSARPLAAANSTASFLFRAITAWRPTLLIDEADTFIRENDELKGLVNAGHTRANAYVGRTVSVGDGHEPRLFDVWSAKAFAGIALDKHLPDATMSRGILTGLRRKLPHERIERLRHAPKELFATLSAKLARFSQDYSEQVRNARPALPEELSDREQDNWEALISIAGCAGPEWVQRATAAALALSRTADASVSTGNELLADIRSVFEKMGVLGSASVVRIPTVDLIAALVADPEKAWATFNNGKPLTPRQLAKQVGAYGPRSKTVRQPDGTTPKGYDVSQFEDAFARYLPVPEELTPPRRAVASAMPGKAPGVADEAPHSVAKVAAAARKRNFDESENSLDQAVRELAEREARANASAEGECMPKLDCGGMADENETLGEDFDEDDDGMY